METPSPIRSLMSTRLQDTQEISAQTLFNRIRKRVLETKHSAELTFANISPSSGDLVSASLNEDPDIESARHRYVYTRSSRGDIVLYHSGIVKSKLRICYNSVQQVITARVMPTPVDGCHVEWLSQEMMRMARSNFLSPDEEAVVSISAASSE